MSPEADTEVEELAGAPDSAPGADAPSSHQGEQTSELERSLGLPAAMSVGMGTMIGAGIFVFPGLAAGEAGPAATLSFALGAGVAILVALPASELATAMPRSGGGYMFVSRGLGTLPGALVGLGQWFGLVFASAFYLVGFGYYLADVASSLGLAASLPRIWIGFATAVVLTVIGLLGTRKAGSLQNLVVGLLLVILLSMLGYGALRGAGVVGDPLRSPADFAPFGALPVLTTAALVFTSYLGFAQIATVAGEIKNPGRNIPLAMIGSVLAVGTLYVATIFVATRTLSSGRLAELGETAMVGVARELAGGPGAALFLFGGVLATLSSANASILSSSRSVFALSRDRLVPAGASAVNGRFRTPHVALLLAGIPIAGLTLLGRVEVLAEVASLLHLVMYGLICVALVALRRREPEGYAPLFRCPGHPVVPLLGAAASFGLIAFMEPLSMAVGGAVLAAAAAWQRLYAPDLDLKKEAS